jgi:RHH-type proline utilization regulon transcriptional repressor/proline dehydrogenase/delta 1-pyrroline-5-carboxylate dehydrogenase
MGALSSSDRQAIRAAKFLAEEEAITELRRLHGLQQSDREAILLDARALLRNVRVQRARTGVVQRLFNDLDLGSPEGLALMSLAEALLRVSDIETAESLIREKLSQGNWQRFRRRARGVELKGVGALMEIASALTDDRSLLAESAGTVAMPVIRATAQKMIEFMARQFVFAPTVNDALAKAARSKHGERYSFDMLGEGARTREQGRHFLKAYADAIEALGAASDRHALDDPSISVKLSALHPRFEASQPNYVQDELLPMVHALAAAAMAKNVGLTIDAEEADRLEPMLDVFEALARSPDLIGWDGLGLAVQAYGKRASRVIAWLHDLGRETHHRFRVRLVKGAYWDAEIKHAQNQGLCDYPVFARKALTDVSYLACASGMLRSDRILAQFATHNVSTVCAINHLANGKSFEFQRLHGMGEELYDVLRARGVTAPVRVYAPVGHFKELLPYLVRRMLENMANTSFVRSTFDPKQEVEAVVSDPIAAMEASQRHTVILPRNVFAGRKNSAGLDLADPTVLNRVSARANEFGRSEHRSDGKAERLPKACDRAVVLSPTDRRRILGEVLYADPRQVDDALDSATKAFKSWRRTSADERAKMLERAADLLEAETDAFIAIIVSEAGRTFRDAIAEVREAIDFCRFYASEARRLFRDHPLPSVTGESNVLRLVGRGPFVCISPWNFPLAIFLGQVVAALAAGNTVVAKPAEQTPLTAMAAISLLHRARIPKDVLHLVQGAGDIGALLTSDVRTKGVAFTGSTDVAQLINRSLAARNAAIAPLIAETGGINAMIVDGSALPEQVVDDVLASGFTSAGQRCSSLRHLFLPEESADHIIDMIAGAMETLRIGDPAEGATDIGPLIDEAARDAVNAHIEAMTRQGARIVKQIALPDSCKHGCFVAPTLIELPSMDMLKREVFGPVVHVTRWRRDTLESLIEHIRNSGYGLTLGIHSRIAGFAERMVTEISCGNSYINRNMIGAVVGAQPFGGSGLSGTGPKAGGPNYLTRFATEEVVTTNLAAIGGDVSLLTG